MRIKQIFKILLLIGVTELVGCCGNHGYINATVLEEKEIIIETTQVVKSLFRAPFTYIKKQSTYNLTFRTDNNKIYHVNVVNRCGESLTPFLALKDAISEGAKIKIKENAFNRFNGFSGILVADEIEFLSDE